MIPFLIVITAILLPVGAVLLKPMTVAFLSVQITNRHTLSSPLVIFHSTADDNQHNDKLPLRVVVSSDNRHHEEKRDTVRVCIWKALASGKELSLKELGALVGEGRQGDLKAHLLHVEKQAKTLKNKNVNWRRRRGISTTNIKKTNKLRIRTRRGEKNQVFVRLG